jgi:hypothetical protein
MASREVAMADRGITMAFDLISCKIGSFLRAAILVSKSSESMDPGWRKMIDGPFNYTAALKGKDLRSEFIEIFGKWTGAKSSLVDSVKRVIGILHNASLMYVQQELWKLSIYWTTLGLMTWKMRQK